MARALPGLLLLSLREAPATTAFEESVTMPVTAASCARIGQRLPRKMSPRTRTCRDNILRDLLSRELLQYSLFFKICQLRSALVNIGHRSGWRRRGDYVV